jgi:hypothetical protein
MFQRTQHSHDLNPGLETKFPMIKVNKNCNFCRPDCFITIWRLFTAWALAINLACGRFILVAY